MFVPSAGANVGDRYALIEEIGRGGMGSVWRAEHTGLGAACAVKFMLGEFGNDASIRQRFLLEARAAARLQSPHVVRVFDVDEWQGSPYIAMELLEGETLAARLERAGALSSGLACEIIDQVARALGRAHAARLVHRDLKPENVFLVKQEPGEPLLVKVLDFGLAKYLDVVGPNATKTGSLLGTPGYMSPEQALGLKAVDERSDLWSLAAVAYYCVTGKEPFAGEGVGEVLLLVMHAALPVPSRDNPAVPPAFDLWWARSAQRDPAARPSSAALLARDLRVALGVATQSASVPGALELAFAETVAVGTRVPTRGGTLQLAEPSPGPLAPAQSPGTLAPASASRATGRDGFSAYALGAAGVTALAAIGLALWLQTRAAPVNAPGPQPAPSSASAEPRLVPLPTLDSPAPRAADDRTGKPAVAPSSSGDPAMPSVAGRSAGAIPAPAAPAPGKRERAPKPATSAVRSASPPVDARARLQPSPAVAAPSQRPAPPPTEKKHERLGV